MKIKWKRRKEKENSVPTIEGKKKQKEKGQENGKFLWWKQWQKKCISISKVAWQRRKIMANKGNRKEGENWMKSPGTKFSLDPL